jgi:metallo-beta-lactamase class B
MLRSCCTLFFVALALRPQVLPAQNPAWTRPFPPFRIAGNLYYVGSEDLAAYLVVTPAGDILINSNLPESPEQIRASVEKLGFHMKDIKVLLISHAHFDHAGGGAAVLKMTGAKYEVMDGDVPVVESGGAADFDIGKDPKNRFPAAHVDRVLHDGDTVSLGGAVLTAHKTAGHTRGCTTWSMPVQVDGATANAVIVCSVTVLNSYKLAGTESYSGIAADYRHTFQTLRALPCDVFLASHASFFGSQEKYARLGQSSTNPFIDPQGYKQFIADSEAEFEAILKKQEHAQH